jgi:hypothetical protein
MERKMKTTAITPDSAEGYLYRAQRTLKGLDEGARIAARFHGERLLHGLFSMSTEEIQVVEDDRIDIAAFEWIAADGEISTGVLARIKQVILNLGVARVFSSLGTSLDSRRRAKAARSASILSPLRKAEPAA